MDSQSCESLIPGQALAAFGPLILVRRECFLALQGTGRSHPLEAGAGAFLCRSRRLDPGLAAGSTSRIAQANALPLDRPTRGVHARCSSLVLQQNPWPGVLSFLERQTCLRGRSGRAGAGFSVAHRCRDTFTFADRVNPIHRRQFDGFFRTRGPVNLHRAGVGCVA